MKLLAFDTSNQALSVALMEDDQLVADLSLTVKKNHSISLMPTIDFLMAQAGWKPSDLDRIAVAQGPGSYTGLRVAVATAKTLAYTLNIDLVGVSSLLALTDLDEEGLVVPLIDARRNNVYAGFYLEGHSVTKERHSSLSDVLAFVKEYPNVTFVGEVEAFQSQIKDTIPWAKLVPSLPSARLIARVGRALPAADVDAFIPDYLKRVEAEETWLKTHQDTDPGDYVKRV
ncbi:tRNA (adenosine(37)-N6)-threonylcarbamoyltransferase complex dimerization subunit type 1 TsaB [Streptococcus dentasini]